MDVLLLPAPEGTLDRRLPAVAELLAALAAQGAQERLIAYLPRSGDLAVQSQLLELLIEAGRSFACRSVLVLEVAEAGMSILEHPCTPLVDELIVVLDLDRDAPRSPASALTSYTELLGEDSSHRLAVWVQGGERGGYRRLAEWIHSGFPEGLEIACAQFTRGWRDACSDSPAVGVSPLGTCRLFEGALTFDGEGRMLPCPRHEGHPALPNLGHLLEHSADELVGRRAALSGDLGRLELCRTCRLPGRLAWRVPAAPEVFDSAPEAPDAMSGEGPELDRPPTFVGEPVRFEPVGAAPLGEIGPRLERWRTLAALAHAMEPSLPWVSIETPVVRGTWLVPCIESVLAQTSPRWHFSLLWDGGDELSREILQHLDAVGHPRITVDFAGGLGIARARRFLTERSTGDYILPLDDDDLLVPFAVERFLASAAEMSWGGILRARRGFVDARGRRLEMRDWFPFEPRTYFRGMTCDLYNHSQPALITRAAYRRTAGWEGFPEYRYAGEDCDIFLKIEEVAEIELLDEVLYLYRVNPSRTSLDLGLEAAQDMWRRIALTALQRRQLAMKLVSREQPFVYSFERQRPARITDLDILLVGDPTLWERALPELGLDGEALHLLPPGCARARLSEAARSCRRRFVCMVHGDVEPPPGAAFRRLLAVLAAGKADLVAPRLCTADGRIASAVPYFDLDMTPCTRSGEPDRGQYDHATEVPWLPSAFLLLKREVARCIAGFSEELPPGALSDADFCLQARSRNFVCGHVGELAVTVRSPLWWDCDGAGLQLFRRRWSRQRHLLDPRDLEQLLRMPG